MQQHKSIYFLSFFFLITFNSYSQNTENQVIEKQTLIKSEDVKETEEPAEYITIERTVLVGGGDGSTEWGEIKTEPEKISDEKIMKVKKALLKRGYSIASADNAEYDTSFHAALQDFQQKNRLSCQGITPETLRFLGIK
jgi:hypothetical protein